MTPLKSLLDPPSLLCIDASAAINLNASGAAERIIAALPAGVMITEAAYGELKVCRKTGRDDGAMCEALVANGSLTRASLSVAAEEAFLRLTVGAAAETLDDGEAATIAHAQAVSAIAVIDERKGGLLAAKLFPSLRVASTIDLMAEPSVLAALGADELGEAVFRALQQARMRLPEMYFDWAERTIGVARLAQCESIPLDRRQALLRRKSEGA